MRGSTCARSSTATIVHGSLSTETERRFAVAREYGTQSRSLCRELADENAGGGDLSDLRSRLVTLRLTEHVDGIEEAEEAALALESVVGSPPRLATPGHLYVLGAATLRLERALGETSTSPFAAAMQQARVAVDELALEVESGYKLPLEV